MFEILPGILEKEWSAIEQKLETVKRFTKHVHIDIVDGKFAPNKTFLDPTPFVKYKDELFFELHMMVDEPIQYLKPFAKAGFKRFLGHIEKMSDQVAFVAEAQLLGEVGLVIDGKTPIEKISVPLDDLDTILCMTINAGFSGQPFMPDVLEKIKTLSQKTSVPIEVDGGVNNETILKARDAGATRFVTTSYLFGDNDPEKAYRSLHTLLSTS